MNIILSFTGGNKVLLLLLILLLHPYIEMYLQRSSMHDLSESSVFIQESNQLNLPSGVNTYFVSVLFGFYIVSDTFSVINIKATECFLVDKEVLG